MKKMSTALYRPGPNVKVRGFGEIAPVQPLATDVCVRVIVYVLSRSGPSALVYEYQKNPAFPPVVQPSPECGLPPSSAFADHS